ncbi:hypothetical protein HMI56_006234 [Coelomomyces lativittatus]|nr:hypothetical protein HMI56_006234 [Coelomomyces lativittatus]
MTINESQGQTFEKLGINLHQPVFSHRQIYVVLSSCKTSTEIKVVLPAGPIQNQKHRLYWNFGTLSRENP